MINKDDIGQEMGDEISGERDIDVIKVAEKEILEEKYLNRTAFETIKLIAA
jgi:hypothetical protein